MSRQAAAADVRKLSYDQLHSVLRVMSRFSGTETSPPGTGTARLYWARLLPILLVAPAVWAQIPVSVLVPHTQLHGHYLFNRSYTYDALDDTGLPWRFYYANVGSNAAPSALRTRCAWQEVNGAPYNHANFGWFRFPTPGGNGAWPPANGTEP